MEKFLLKNQGKVESITKEVERDEKIDESLKKLGNHALVLSKCSVNQLPGFPPALDISDIRGNQTTFKEQLYEMVLVENCSTLLETNYHILLLEEGDGVQLVLEELSNNKDQSTFNTKPSRAEVADFYNREDVQIRDFLNDMSEDIEENFNLKVKGLSENTMSVDISNLEKEDTDLLVTYIFENSVVFEQLWEKKGYVFGDTIINGKLIFYAKEKYKKQVD